MFLNYKIIVVMNLVEELLEIDSLEELKRRSYRKPEYYKKEV